MAAVSSEPLVFSGTPRHLSAVAAVPAGASAWRGRWEARCVGPTDEEALGGPVTVEHRRDTRVGVHELAVGLPPSTPPGRYQVTIDFDGHERPAVLEVQPKVRSLIYPKRTHLTARTGKTANTALHVCNTGNVPIDVPSMSAFMLADSDALCRAIVTTVSTQRESAERPVDRLADELLKGYGGTVKARIRTTERRIEPGEVKELSAALRMPDEMEPGRSYWGLWSVHPGKAHRVFVDAIR